MSSQKYSMPRKNHVDDLLNKIKSKCEIDGKQGTLSVLDRDIKHWVEEGNYLKLATSLFYNTTDGIEDSKLRNITYKLLKSNYSTRKTTSHINKSNGFVDNFITIFSNLPKIENNYIQNPNLHELALETISMAFHSIKEVFKERGKHPSQPTRNDLSFAGQLLYCYHGKTPSKELENILDTILIIAAEHGKSNSAFACIVSNSSQYRYSRNFTFKDSVISAFSALAGSLHGGSISEAYEMLEKMHDENDMRAYINDALAAKISPNQSRPLLWGFGHKQYKSIDPRSIVVKGLQERLFPNFKNIEKWEKFAELVQENEQCKQKQINFPNVDFWLSCIGPKLLGIPTEGMTLIFGLAKIFSDMEYCIQAFDNKVGLLRPNEYPQKKEVGEFTKKENKKAFDNINLGHGRLSLIAKL